jgi:putative transposase
MARLRRSELLDGHFHLTAFGAGGVHIFLADLDRLDFLRALDIVSSRFTWRLLAYCLMGTHYHLLVETKAADLAPGMRWLNGVYARGFNKRHQRRGHLFGARYDSYVVRDDVHLEAATRYVLENPVRAGLCPKAEDWPWSYAASRPASRLLS